MRKFSISDKLILVSLFLSIVTIIIVASYSFYKTKDAILDRTFNQLTSIRVVKSNLVEKFFSTCLTEIQLAKSSSDIKKIAQQIIQIPSSSEYQEIDDSLVNFTNPFLGEISKKYYNKITIVGKNKLIYNIKKNESELNKSVQDYDSLWINSITSETPFISDLKKSDNLSQAYITISSKIADVSNEVIAIIIFDVSISPINSIMLEVNHENGFGISGESYLVGQDYLMRTSSRFQTNSVLKTIVKTEAVNSAFNGLSGTKIIKDYRGVSVLSSYSKINIPNLNWIILAEIDYKEATVQIFRIRNEIVFISIFIFLIVLVVIFFISKRITYPIKRLNYVAHEVGKGNLDIEITKTSNDEVGELTETFNKMVQKLKEQTKDIETERMKSLRSLIDGQESERQRLSRELHDSLGQLLIGLKLKYESCLNQLKINSRSDNKFDELGLLFDKTIEETRHISNDLMSAALSEFGLTTAIRNLCNEISETSKINIRFIAEGNKKSIDIQIKNYLYRIIQEALTNILKHSKANNATVKISYKEDIINLSIQDDGQGFDKMKIKFNSNGLNNIKDRVKLLSGTFLINSEIQKGTLIDIDVPLKGKNYE